MGWAVGVEDVADHAYGGIGFNHTSHQEGTAHLLRTNHVVEPINEGTDQYRGRQKTPGAPSSHTLRRHTQNNLPLQLMELEGPQRLHELAGARVDREEHLH